jgi:hypothetical protein
MNSPVPGIYHHFKDASKEYEVLGIAMHTETKEELVIYRALYGEGHLYARPAAMFLEEVDKPEYSYQGPRFVFVRPGL